MTSLPRARAPSAGRPRLQAAPAPPPPTAAELCLLLRLVVGGCRTKAALAALPGQDEAGVAEGLGQLRWLGLLEEGEPLRAGPRGLEVGLSPEADRIRLLATAAWRTESFLAVMGGQTELPGISALEEALSRPPCGMGRAAARAQAASMRGWVPEILAHRPTRADPVGEQLGLPLRPAGPRPPAGLSRPLEAAAGEATSPDLHARLLLALLDHGELTSPQVHALMEQLGGHGASVGAVIQLAIRRGDAHRFGAALVVSEGAIKRREVAGDPVLVALTDPDWRRHLAQLAAGEEAGPDRAQRQRNRAWDRRILGEIGSPEQLRVALERVLPGRLLSALPPAGEAGPAWAPPAGPYLAPAQGRLVTFPSSLVGLRAPLAQQNRLLARLRAEPAASRLPTVWDPHQRAHGGLVAPGEALPRVIPDRWSLRLRALATAPAIALSAAILLLARAAPARISLSRSGDELLLHAHRRRPLPLLAALGDFVAWQGDRLSHPPAGGLRAAELGLVLESIGVAVATNTGLALTEDLAVRLARDPDADTVRAGLDPLMASLSAWLAEA